MAKVKQVFGCTECGATYRKWQGRCSACGAMNTVVALAKSEQLLTEQRRDQEHAAQALVLEGLDGGSGVELERYSSGIAEFDRVLGGGLSSGSAVLIGGEPGIGKSTLLAQACGGWAERQSVAYCSGEESLDQVRARCARLGITANGMTLAASGDGEAIAGLIRSRKHPIVIVDSIQTVHLPGLEASAGSPAQVRSAAAVLVEAAKASHVALILVGQVTKDGTLAGPRMLEHLVDTVIAFEGDRYQDLRTLRAVKNRHGSTNEIGLFSMAPQGLQEVTDPGAVFITDRAEDSNGSCVVPALEGNRCLLLEVQALVNPTEAPQPARRVAGCDHNRVAMVLAVLTRRLRMPLGNCDVFVNVTGGAKIVEPAADLGIALALVSAWREQAVPADLVALGEVGLGGELRPASRYELRAAEARRLGFKRLLGPGSGGGRGRLVCNRLDAAIEQAFG